MKARVSKTGEELIEPLTRREREVLTLLAQGYSAPEIAQQLTLALSSVKWYVQQVYGKLGVNNKQRAILRAGELGLLETRSLTASVHFIPKHNLPHQLTSFIGREKEIETVNSLIVVHNGSRLLTLTGAGGSGKTRLALEVATHLRDVFPDGVWFIELAPLSNPMLVPQTVVITLGLHEDVNRSALTILADFLQPKQILLILDNCEHLIQACAQLAETLLHACPTLRILATSREALGIAGESTYLIPTLTTPNPKRVNFGTVPQYEAVRLFVERAQTAWSGFALTDENTLAVVQVCHQLDGIPLALELAAARVKVLRVEQIAARLAERDQFRLLTGGSRTALPRHQTLNALIDWSHDLLSEPERRLFRRLAVFAGGWTLEAAESVCAGKGVEENAVLDLMTQLVNKSLILAEREQDQEVRYRMLETIRQYASERLLEAGEGEQLRNRHLDFFLNWVERVEPELRGPEQLKWLDQLESEHDNLRTTLEWGLAQAGRGENSLRLAGALLTFWRRRGYISEGRAWLARVLASPGAPLACAARAEALYAAGYLARYQGDTTSARTLLEASRDIWSALDPTGRTGLAHTLAALGDVMIRLGNPAKARALANEGITLARQQGERGDEAYSLLVFGMASRDQEDFTLARSVINESITIWRGMRDPWGVRHATYRLGEVAMREGDYKLAHRLFAESLTAARQLGDEDGSADALINLGMTSLNLGDRGQAKSFFEQGYRRVRESGDKINVAVCFYYFGYLAMFEGDIQQAKTFFEQELALARTTGPLWLGSQALFGLAGIAAASGQASRAARLFGAAEARLEAGASYIDAADGLLNERTVASTVPQLGEAAFSQARAEGRAMTFEQAADYAMETEPSA